MSTEYIHFTAEQKEAARQTDLVSLLQSQGEHLKRSGKEYVWRDGSEKVTVRGNLWFHQYERIGGDAVDFVRRFYNMDFPQAVNFLLGNNGFQIFVRGLARHNELRRNISPVSIGFHKPNSKIVCQG